MISFPYFSAFHTTNKHQCVLVNEICRKFRFNSSNLFALFSRVHSVMAQKRTLDAFFTSTPAKKSRQQSSTNEDVDKAEENEIVRFQIPIIVELPEKKLYFL